ncbi:MULTISPECIES: ribosome biogenesis GTPase Der [Thiorhodovibrio]|uniref:ribosome biogenesis GTPase Der n=1 Tax=Thiorhodovibrio TaxID=61593 RepID=UPI001913DBBF|nr:MULTISPECIES: ribosome biogenesis GTPase Der [Thiorhodovibrio]MBK5968911.1 ribosome biogenesis GTPase Der [Thiorhodovibrio winogradskyi]WPL14364.1 GTP-binding protein EngA [Thiorhodovibrio litoralis]
MLPVITLVGRPNVGKSTLFNRLTRSRNALVADFPGLTRDRQYGLGQLGARPYLLVDTGGLSGGRDALEVLTERQVRLAIEEADHLLFMVDARDGCVAGDLDIAAELRRTGKPLTLAVNKVDRLDADQALAEFHRLGLGEPVAIAASHGRGLSTLLERVYDALPEAVEDPEAAAAGQGIQIAVVGRPNAGKSTLINRLLGEERVVASDMPGTTRDSLFIPFQVDGRDYTLIDTAGMRRRAKVTELIEKYSVIKAMQAIDACNVAILVIDARAGIGEQDATLAAHIIDSGRALVVAVNKWDGLSGEERNAIRDTYQRKLGFLDFAERFQISALHGSNVGHLLEAVERAYASAFRDLPTPLLTRLLEDLVSEHQPPLVHGRRIKLRYAHQGGRNPPVIVIHGNQAEAVPDPYRRFLINRFRSELKLGGTPLRLELKSGTNPFAGKRNTLTPSQQRQRERLKRFVSRKKR